MSLGAYHQTVATPRCPTCGSQRSTIAYVRATNAHLFLPDYHLLGRDALVLAYQQEYLTRFRRRMDYDRLVDWARTTPRQILGRARCKGEHPLRRYLQDTAPLSPNGYGYWTIFPSACDALKGFAQIPHIGSITHFTNTAVEATGVTFTAYSPLPVWASRVSERLEELPAGSVISREMFLTLLHATRPRPERLPLRGLLASPVSNDGSLLHDQSASPGANPETLARWERNRLAVERARQRFLRASSENEEQG